MMILSGFGKPSSESKAHEEDLQAIIQPCENQDHDTLVRSRYAEMGKAESEEQFQSIVVSVAAADAATAAERHQRVIALRPVGYWPADEGGGEVLHDRSATGNQGRLRNVRWRGDLLDFANDHCQWAEIPHHAVYSSDTFTVGG